MKRLAIVAGLVVAGLVVAGSGCGDNLPAAPDATAAPAGYADPAIQGVLDLPAQPFVYDPDDLPPHFKTPDVTRRINTPADDPITDTGATLGRVLFYDTALSVSRTVACASCHQQDRGFADTARRSEGFSGELTGRNSMGLSNVRYYEPGRMFWDERADSVEHQVLMPIQSDVEMGMELDPLVARLRTLPYYPPLFELAFGDRDITSDRISRALSQYVRAILSYRSRYDQALVAAGGNPMGPFASFTAAENLGKDLFFRPPGAPGGKSARCAVCHLSTTAPPGPPGPNGANLAIFMMDRPRNNGLHLDTTADEGVGGGRFKSPSLRNSALTAPYMHDGSLPTLRAVVAFYNAGVQPHPNLDPRLRDPQTGQPIRLGLAPGEIDALVAFLDTLTDTALVTDERFEDPFRD